jgi:hypothetical protein
VAIVADPTQRAGFVMAAGACIRLYHALLWLYYGGGLHLLFSHGTLVYHDPT